jgi:outer membrane protein OmpA-like peptidoglycan-associated protein
VEEARLEAHGFGPDCPLMPGRTPNARRANRRVQFLITGPDTAAGQCHNPTSR